MNCATLIGRNSGANRNPGSIRSSHQAELDDVVEHVRAARGVMNRIEIRAPVTDIVVRLLHNTRGDVVAAGAVVLELLPVEDELVIEARLNPKEIVHVREGRNAMVRLFALNQRLTSMVEGTVIYLSADTISQRGAGPSPPWLVCCARPPR